MMRISATLALLAALLPPAAAGLTTSRSLPTGPNPVDAAIDTASGRVFVANAGAGRYGAGMSYTVIEPDGRSTTFPDDQSPLFVAVSAALRRVILVNGGMAGSSATILDADTLQRTRVATGANLHRPIIVDANATAYLVGQGTSGTQGPGSITEVDLRAATSRIVPVPGFSSEQLAVVPARGRAYVAGNGVPGGVALAATAWIQAYDLAAHALVGMPTRLPGRQVEGIFAAPDGSRLYVLAHVDATEMRYGIAVPSLRAAVFVVDPATLAVTATHLLPDMATPLVIPFAQIIDPVGPQFFGMAVLDPEGRNLYALEYYNRRLTRLDLETGALVTVPVEGYTHALEFNAATRTLLVTYVDGGYLGLFSRDLERLDSVRLGTPTPRAESVGLYAVVSHPASADVYATYPKDSVLVRVTLPAPADAQRVVNYTDLWSQPAEPGWGLFVDQQGVTAFGALFTTAADGQSEWLVMSAGQREADGAFAGSLYRTRGPAPQALANATAVGTMRFAPDATGAATLAYSVDGATITRTVQRQQFRDEPRRCGWTTDLANATVPGINYTALWWNAAEPGWGLTVSHQGDTAFAVLYAYDAQGRAEWTVMSNGALQADGAFAGSLHRVRSGRVETAGTMTLRFTGTATGVLETVVDGATLSRPIARQVFARPTSDCRN